MHLGHMDTAIVLLLVSEWPQITWPSNPVTFMLDKVAIKRVYESSYFRVVVDHKLLETTSKSCKNKHVDVDCTIAQNKRRLQSKLITYMLSHICSSIHYLLCGGYRIHIQNIHKSICFATEESYKNVNSWLSWTNLHFF